MKYIFLKHIGTKNVTIFFGGWGSGPELFRPMLDEGSDDCIFVWDYRGINTHDECERLCGELTAFAKDYDSVNILAWSLGVVAARQILSSCPDLSLSSTPTHPVSSVSSINHVDPNSSVNPVNQTNPVNPISPVCSVNLVNPVSSVNPINPTNPVNSVSSVNPTHAIAVNGTEHPADDLRGIPVKIFEATLEMLSEASLVKFRRRMCGKDLQSFMENLPHRGIDELKDELAQLLELSKRLSQSTLPPFWTEAVIGMNDMIFPADNQKNEWEGKVETNFKDEYHWCPETFRKLLNASF